MKNKSPSIDDKLYAKLVREVGYPTKTKMKIDVQMAHAMFENGWSYRQIGEHFGMSGITVKRRMRSSGVI